MKPLFRCQDFTRMVGINPQYLTEDYAQSFKKTLNGETESSMPFPHFSLPDFIDSPEFLEDLRSELKTAEYYRKENDLFSLNQTSDLANYDEKNFPNLVKFRQFVKTTVLSWLKKISGIELNTEVAITSSRYDFTDLLLPHDDQLEGRKFAFIVYLSPDWKAEQGGQLLLYNCDDENCPISVTKTLNPKENTLLMFEVSPRSWHMVTEVTSNTSSRLSLHGWFHCDEVDVVRTPKITPEIRHKPHMDITYEEVLEWINPEYLDCSRHKKIRILFEKNSEINLINFLRSDKYKLALDELEKCDFEELGPPSKRKIERLREYALNRDSNLDSLLRLLKSQAMALLLSQWTGLILHSSADCGGESDEPSPKKSRVEQGGDNEDCCRGIECCTSVSRVGKGSYTMADDQLAYEAEQNGPCLELKLFLSNDEWDDGYGGFCSFIAEDEEEEVLRVSPVANGAALVFREPDVFPFIKYVNCRAENRNYFVVSCSFYGMAIENDDESTDDEELEESAGDNES